MTFRELFWAHLTLPVMRWRHIFMAVFIGAYVIIALYEPVLSYGVRQALVLPVLAFVSYGHTVFYALAGIPASATNRAERKRDAKEFYEKASWPIFLSQNAIMVFLVFLMFFGNYTSLSPYLAIGCAIAVIVSLFVRLWRKRAETAKG